MPKRTNQRLPSCLRDPSRRLHPLRELSSVPDHLTEEADSQGESVETARGLDSDPETEIDLRAATSPVVPAVGQQFVVPSRHIEQPQRQAMEGVRKFISSLIFRKSSEEVAHQLMERFEEYSTHNRWGAGSIVQGSRTSKWLKRDLKKYGRTKRGNSGITTQQQHFSLLGLYAGAYQFLGLKLKFTLCMVRKTGKGHPWPYASTYYCPYDWDKHRCANGFTVF
ncbi:hypothetical protein OUZ56_006057 [Daphnia magna]|uniref:Uncharacterized protein n=1 Tax=Daphnia magna TaxID=35525 RepID=A0ABQ9YUI7_9CRUS|nr:hypothetical protein OUZ56_006057 [Daphnia magna]